MINSFLACFLEIGVQQTIWDNIIFGYDNVVNLHSTYPFIKTNRFLLYLIGHFRGFDLILLELYKR